MKDKVIIASVIALIVIDLIYFMVKNRGTTDSAIVQPNLNASPVTGVQTPGLNPGNPLPSTGRPSIDASKVRYEDDEGLRGSGD